MSTEVEVDIAAEVEVKPACILVAAFALGGEAFALGPAFLFNGSSGNK